MSDFTNVGYDAEFENFEVSDYIEESDLAKKIENLITDANQELYPRLREVVKVIFCFEVVPIKSMDGMTNKSFTDVLKLFKERLLEGVNFHHLILN